MEYVKVKAAFSNVILIGTKAQVFSKVIKHVTR
jgi:hypothetical protein